MDRRKKIPIITLYLMFIVLLPTKKGGKKLKDRVVPLL